MWRSLPFLFRRSHRRRIPTLTTIMNRTQPMHHRAAAPRRARTHAFDTIEWEELPSLAPALRRNDFGPSGHVWHSTEPMDLQPPAVGLPSPFAEPIDGMQVREIEGDGLFGHFFSGAQNH